MIKPRNELLNDINRMYGDNNESNLFPYHIYYLRFPRFKNFEDNLKVNLSYPITFITGTNGSGKSSFLHALYGSVAGHNIEDFWFETAMDPIIEIENNRQCFIASFKTLQGKKQVEIIKTRIKRKENPDYWEPSRPQPKYNMEPFIKGKEDSDRSATRWKLQERKVYYIDFRHTISAFDKFFYFETEDRNRKKRQDTLRKRAKNLNKAFNRDESGHYYKQTIDKPIHFDQGTIKIISDILGKEYHDITYTVHDLYSKEFGKGFVMRYSNGVKTNYSEAYAGSGETVISKMIYDLCGVEENALVLLDEPETSLHPQAQKKLIDYLMDLIIRKKIQVVISTHSPDIIENMPNQAINVFYEDQGKTCVRECVSPSDAFIQLGHNITEKQIFVEDELAKHIVDKIIKKESHTGIFKIEPYVGGAQSIYKAAVEFSKIDGNLFDFILDGDQKPPISKDSIRDAIDRVSISMQELNDLVKTITRTEMRNLPFNPDGSGTCNENQKKSLVIKFIKFYIHHVHFLPKNLPEEIIYSDEYLEKICGQFTLVEKNEIKEERDYKNKFVLISQYKFGSHNASDILACEREFTECWSKVMSSEYSAIKKFLDQLS